MRRWIRRAGKAMAVLVAAVVVTLVALVGRVDRTPYQGTEYSGATLARLTALQGKPLPTIGDLRAGFGKALLTPKLGAVEDVPARGEFKALPLAGFGSRGGRPAEGALDELWIKALAVETGGLTGVVVSADALIVPRAVADMVQERVERELGLPPERMYMGATHTHGGLGGWGEGLVAEMFAGGYVPGVCEWMADRMVAAISLALADLSPAEAGSGEFDAPELTRNRLVGDRGRIDPRFSWLSVRQRDGDGLVVGAFSAHATVVSSGEMKFHGDYPGVWQRRIEESTGGMAMFLAGAVGSHAPKTSEGGWVGAKHIGETLGDATIKALSVIVRTNRLVWDVRTLAVDLPPLQPRVSDGLRLREWAARRLLPVQGSTWIQVFRLGNAVWVSTPCDYSGEMSIQLAERSRAQGVSVCVTSFNGDYVGYVVPSEYYGMNTYETRTMAFFGPQLGDYFAALVEGVTRSVSPSLGERVP